MNTRSLRAIGIRMCFALALAAACAPKTATPVPPVTEALQAESEVESEYAQARQRMVEVVRDWGLENEVVLQALGAVPRHEFVPAEYLPQAYANHPLPIGYGQTISQPYIVGLMTEQLGVQAGAKILEVGTGSGYQAAILAELGMEVYTIEIIEPLAERASAVLMELGYEGIHVMHADGYFGWQDHAPFDGILVTAAPDHVPQPLIDQLAVGATMVIPVGPAGGYQELWRITRSTEGAVDAVSLGGVRFVPLTRQESP